MVKGAHMGILEQLAGSFEAWLGHSILLSYAAAYAAGLVTSLTPCVYPVIPVTVACIGGQENRSAGRGFFLSFIYVLGVAATYTALGIAAALTGKLFGTIQSGAFTQLLLGGLFVVMGLSMLGVFHLARDFSAPLRNRASGATGAAGTFLLGLTSGFILGPCTTPVLSVILGVVAARQSIVFGGSLLFVFSLGVGTLLLVIGTFTGLLASLPRSGAWMSRVQKGSGIILIAMGVYFLYGALAA